MIDMTCGTVVLLPGLMNDERLFNCQAEGLKQEAQRPFEVIIPRRTQALIVWSFAIPVLETEKSPQYLHN